MLNLLNARKAIHKTQQEAKFIAEHNIRPKND